MLRKSMASKAEFEYSATDTASAEAMLARLIAVDQRLGHLLDLLQGSAKRQCLGESRADRERLRGLKAAIEDYVDSDHRVVEEIVLTAIDDCAHEIELKGAIVELRADHEELKRRAAIARRWLQALLSEQAEAEPLLPQVVDYCQYQRHYIQVRGEVVFPAIRELLTGDRWGSLKGELEARLGRV